MFIRRYFLRKVQALILVAIVLCIAGCQFNEADEEKVRDIEYAIVTEQELPEHLTQMIEERQDKELRMTFSTKEYTYIVVGYGQQQTTGYRIVLNELYEGNEVIVVDTTLVGPDKNTQVEAGPFCPVAVLKIERNDYPVLFKL